VKDENPGNIKNHRDLQGQTEWLKKTSLD